MDIKGKYSYSDDEYHDIFKTKIKNFEKIVLIGIWKDQGYGNRKGKIKNYFKKEPDTIDIIYYNQISPHEVNKLYLKYVNENNIIYDEIIVQVCVGWGGGHLLYLNCKLFVINEEEGILEEKINPDVNELLLTNEEQEKGKDILQEEKIEEILEKKKNLLKIVNYP